MTAYDSAVLTSYATNMGSEIVETLRCRDAKAASFVIRVVHFGLARSIVFAVFETSSRDWKCAVLPSFDTEVRVSSESRAEHICTGSLTNAHACTIPEVATTGSPSRYVSVRSTKSSPHHPLRPSQGRVQVSAPAYLGSFLSNYCSAPVWRRYRRLMIGTRSYSFSVEGLSPRRLTDSDSFYCEWCKVL
jgi:hypothetical protein